MIGASCKVGVLSHYKSSNLPYMLRNKHYLFIMGSFSTFHARPA